MARALITGAAGFIGGALVRRLLAQGWGVHALLGRTCRREALAELSGQVVLHDHDGSMENMLAIVEKAQPDVVFHLAALFLSDHQPKDVGDMVTSNILFSTQLVEAMATTGARALVNTGTSWQHFGTTAYRPVNLYAATKQAFEDMLAYYHEAQGLSCITLKLYDTYGPGDQRRKLINILMEAARTGQPLAMSPGEQEIVLTHADDVAAAFVVAGNRLRACTGSICESYFVDGTRLTLQELVKKIEAVAGRTLDIGWGGRPYRNREVMVPVASKGRALPGWAPGVPLEEGLAGLLAEPRP